MRPIGEMVRAWLALAPAWLRIVVRRARALSRRRRSTDTVIEAATPAGTARVVVGFVQPIVVEGRTIGSLSAHDDGGTSTAETAAALAAEVDVATALALVEAVAQAAFERGNHRVAWSVRDDDAVLLDALAAAGFAHEGLAAPPPGTTDAWQQWARLADDVVPAERHP